MEKAARSLRESFLTSSLERLERSERSGEAAHGSSWRSEVFDLKNVSESVNRIEMKDRFKYSLNPTEIPLKGWRFCFRGIMMIMFVFEGQEKLIRNIGLFLLFGF